MSLGKLLDKLVRTNNPPMWHDQAILNDIRVLTKEEFLAKYDLQALYDSIKQVEVTDSRDELVNQIEAFFGAI